MWSPAGFLRSYLDNRSKCAHSSNFNATTLLNGVPQCSVYVCNCVTSNITLHTLDTFQYSVDLLNCLTVLNNTPFEIYFNFNLNYHISLYCATSMYVAFYCVFCVFQSSRKAATYNNPEFLIIIINLFNLYTADLSLLLEIHQLLTHP